MGRIRLGERVPTAKGDRLRPSKLDTFKFTSAAEPLITEIAGLYGGTPGPYTGEGVRGKQFQVVTEINIIPVYLPRQKIDPFYEQWGGQVCTRRCDGERDMIHDRPCDCNPDKRACKPTTRMNVMLADVTGPGFWRLETHGIYAAMELTQLAMLLQQVDMPLPAKLLLEARQRKFFNRDEGKVEVRDWYTPVVILDNVTPRMLATGGEALERAITGGGRPAVAAAPQARAIEGAPAAPPGPDPAVMQRGLAAIRSAEPGQMDDLRARIAKMGDPEVLLGAFQVRLGEHKVAEMAKANAIARELREDAEQSATAELMTAVLTPELRNALEEDAALAATAGEFEAAWVDNAPPADEPPADSETGTDPPSSDDAEERVSAMGELLTAAGKVKISTKLLDAQILEKYGVQRLDATAEQLRALAAELRERGK